MGTTTSNYSFYKPASGEQGWASLVNANFDDVDSLLFAGDHGNLASDGTLSLHGTAQISLTSSPANWNPTGLSTSTLLFVTLDAARTVHGIVPGAGDVDGLIKMLWNISAFDWTLADDSGTATAANRLRLPSGDVILAQDQGLMIAYDATVSRWRPIGGVQASSGGGGGGAPTDAAYLIASGTPVTGLSGEVLVGPTPGGELDGAGSTHADPAVSSIHGPEALAHHDESHPFDDDAIHTNWTAEVPSSVGLAAVTGTVGANYGDHVHRGAVDLASLDDAVGPFTGTGSDSDQTILTYTLAANTAVAKMRFRVTFAGTFTTDSSATRSVTMKLKVGGTTVLSMLLSLAVNNTNAAFVGDAELIFRTIGSSASLIASGRMTGSDGGGTNWSPNARAAVGTAATKNSTGSLAIALTSVNGNVAASHTIQMATISMAGVA